MAKAINWEAPPLDATDEKIVSAYAQSGQSLDELAYTQAFEEVVRQAGYDPSKLVDCHFVYRRLLSLRKRGRLPRPYAVF